MFGFVSGTEKDARGGRRFASARGARAWRARATRRSLPEGRGSRTRRSSRRLEKNAKRFGEPSTEDATIRDLDGDGKSPRRTCRDGCGGDATPVRLVVVGDPPADVPDADVGGLDPLGVDPLVIRRVAAPRQRARGEGTRALERAHRALRRGNNPRRVRASSRAACPRRGACARGHRRGPGRETRRRVHVSRRRAPSYVGMRFSHIPSFSSFLSV